MRCGLPRGNDSNHLFAAGFLLDVCNDEYGHAARKPKCLPPFFAICDPVEPCYAKRIIKHECRRLEADLVFGQVLAVFMSIPDEPAFMYLPNCTYSIVDAARAGKPPIRGLGVVMQFCYTGRVNGLYPDFRERHRRRL